MLNHIDQKSEYHLLPIKQKCVKNMCRDILRTVIYKYGLNICRKNGHHILIYLVYYFLMNLWIGWFYDALKKPYKLLEFLHINRKAAAPLMDLHNMHKDIKCIFLMLHVF